MFPEIWYKIPTMDKNKIPGISHKFENRNVVIKEITGY